MCRLCCRRMSPYSLEQRETLPFIQKLVHGATCTSATKNISQLGRMAIASGSVIKVVGPATQEAEEPVKLAAGAVGMRPSDYRREVGPQQLDAQRKAASRVAELATDLTEAHIRVSRTGRMVQKQRGWQRSVAWLCHEPVLKALEQGLGSISPKCGVCIPPNVFCCIL